MSAEAGGRKLLRLEIRNAETPIERKPEWIRTKASMGPEYRQLQALVKSEELHTVCQEAGCPNIFECWEDREATFLIGAPSARGAATSARSTPGSPRTTTRTSPGASASRWRG